MIGGGGCTSNQQASGNSNAPTIEASETYFVMPNTATNKMTIANIGAGVKYKKAPTKLATALPP